MPSKTKLKALNLDLPAPPEPFGTYAEAVQTGNLLFLSGMLPTEGGAAKFVGRVGAELGVEAGREAARLAAMNALAVARRHLGSLDRVKRIVRLGVFVATSGDIRDQPKIADGASDLLEDIFGRDKNPSRLVYGVASLPLGVPVELEVIFEVQRVVIKGRLLMATLINCAGRDTCDERDAPEIPHLLSNYCGRWTLDFLPGGRSKRRACDPAASRAPLLFEDV